MEDVRLRDALNLPPDAATATVQGSCGVKFNRVQNARSDSAFVGYSSNNQYGMNHAVCALDKMR